VHEVLIPFFYIRVVDVVIAAHLPVAHVHLLQSLIQDGIRETAIGSELTGSGEGRGIGGIDVTIGDELSSRHFRLLFESVSDGYVAPSVAGTTGDINAGMSDEDDFHNATKVV
jgi:hypothetical protein